MESLNQLCASQNTNMLIWMEISNVTYIRLRFSYEPYHYNYIKTRGLWSIFGKTNQNKIIRRAFQDRPQGALCGADVCSLSITESEATF